MKTIGIYHGNCSDGTTAAAVLLKKFPDIKLFPLSHSLGSDQGRIPEDLEQVLAEVDKDTIVYTIDCALGVKAFIQRAKEVITIDHHIDKQKEMEALARKHSNFTYIFDNDRSGASLAWTHFYGTENIPEIVQLAEDCDLWKWKFGDKTKYYSAAMSLYGNQPDKVAPLFSGDISSFLEGGRQIAVFADFTVRNFVERAESLYLKIGDYIVPAFNARNFVSETGHQLAEKNGRAVAVFCINGAVVRFSFRGKDSFSPSALELAQILGGGGHENASGANIPLKQFCGMIVHDTNITNKTE